MVANVAAAIKAAESKIGSQYVWGATGPSTFDCSGLTQWAWARAGVDIPRTSQQQAKYGTAVKLANIQPGDLVTSNWGDGPSSHVAMYVGGGKVIHAPRPGRTVTLAALDSTYRSKIDAIRRVPGAKSSGADGSVEQASSTGDLLGALGSLFGPGGWAAGEGLGSLGDALGGGDSGSLTDNALGSFLLPFKAMGLGLGSIAQSLSGVGQFAELLLKLALPSTWVRIFSGVLGSILLLLGVGFLVREARGAA